ncbi:hypothetical protein LCGC14_3047420, partial [marine sediment metagenome]
DFNSTMDLFFETIPDIGADIDCPISTILNADIIGKLLTTTDEEDSWSVTHRLWESWAELGDGDNATWTAGARFISGTISIGLYDRRENGTWKHDIGFDRVETGIQLKPSTPTGGPGFLYNRINVTVLARAGRSKRVNSGGVTTRPAVHGSFGVRIDLGSGVYKEERFWRQTLTEGEETTSDMEWVGNFTQTQIDSMVITVWPFPHEINGVAIGDNPWDGLDHKISALHVHEVACTTRLSPDSYQLVGQFVGLTSEQVTALLELRGTTLSNRMFKEVDITGLLDAATGGNIWNYFANNPEFHINMVVQEEGTKIAVYNAGFRIEYEPIISLTGDIEVTADVVGLGTAGGALLNHPAN